MTPAETYKAAKANGKQARDACAEVIKAHPEISFDDVCELSWAIEVGCIYRSWTYQIGFSAGKECAKFCWEECAELHKGEPIWPGDGELVAEKLGCHVKDIDAHLRNDRVAIAELWRGFTAGVAEYNESK